MAKNEKTEETEETEEAVEAVETVEAAVAELDTTAAPARADERGKRKVRVGVVSSDAPDKTVTVTVERRVAHPLYGKLVTHTKKYRAHDENNEYKVGDVVRIAETRPMSKTKRWRVLGLIEQAK